MILTLSASSDSSVSLDFSNQLGESVELCCFQFIEPPVEFRLTRRGLPLQEWQAGKTEIYDLQHGPTVFHFRPRMLPLRKWLVRSNS